MWADRRPPSRRPGSTDDAFAFEFEGSESALPSRRVLSPDARSIPSTIISFAVLPPRRAGHCSRGSLVVIVVGLFVSSLIAVLSMYVVSPSHLHPFLSHVLALLLPQDLHQSPRSTRRPQSPYRCPPTTTNRCCHKAEYLPGPSEGERRQWTQCSPR